jgi:hypothetical protein
LNISANTAIFSFVNTPLFTRPPHREPDRLARLMSQRGALLQAMEKAPLWRPADLSAVRR